MKIALYIEDGREQIVLTPESKTEKTLLGRLHDGTRIMSIKQGAFYGCQGGWTRFRTEYPGMGPDYREDHSTMLVLDRKDDA
jgi:hypothetical protein